MNLGPHLYQAYSQDAFKLVQRGRPAERSDGSDRGCPLGTGIDPSIWHANGTTREAARGPASLPGAIGLNGLAHR